MAWNPENPSNDELLINFPAQCRANWDALALMTNASLLITNDKCSGSMGLVDTKLAQITSAGKVSGAALTLLTNVPGGAGLLPVANVPNLAASKITSGEFDVARIPTGISANKVVKLDGSAKIPAVDASQVTGLIASQIPNLPASKITSGIMATARLGSGSASSSTFLRGDSTWQQIISGTNFGSWVAKSIDTTYYAATDGLLAVRSHAHSANVESHIIGYTDASGSPTIERSSLRASKYYHYDSRQYDNILHNSFTMPVKKGHYYKTQQTCTRGNSSQVTTSLFWLSSGS